MNFDRRRFLSLAAQASLMTLSLKSELLMAKGEALSKPASANPLDWKICLFSKHMEWLSFSEMAKAARAVGFEGIDLTVRPGGHISPEKVETDLPKASEALAKAGLPILSITTSLMDVKDPVFLKTLKTAASLGIKRYRTDWLYYLENETLEENLTRIKHQFILLAEANETFGIVGNYQNHSGNDGSGVYFGAPLWDLASILEIIDSPYMKCQFDIFHAKVENNNSWQLGFNRLIPHTDSIALKDFRWSLYEAGELSYESTPLGCGVLNLTNFFELLRKTNFGGIISMHFEYPLGGAEYGVKTLNCNAQEVIAAMKKDTDFVKKVRQEFIH